MTKKANNRIVFPLSFLVAALMLAGCAKKEQAPPPPQPKPKQAAKPLLPVQNQATSSRAAGSAAQQLNFSNKKDPFKPFVTVEAPAQQKPKAVAVARSGDLLPIQSYDVNKFTVSGIIVGLRENTALVVDPGGRGYVVKEGMLIGNNDGRISRITPSSIVVVEPYRDDHGRLKKKTTTLMLAKKK